jgi:hypothetical protein
MQRRDIWKAKEVLKDMSWQERIDYIWSYFGVYIIIGTVCLAVLISILATVLRPQKEVLLSGVSVNVTLTEEGERYLSDKLFAPMGGTDAEQQMVEFTPRFLGSKEDYEGYSAQVMGMVALVAAQSLDYAILDKEALEQFAGGQMFDDVRNLLTAEQIAALEGKLITMEYEEVGAIPVAIDISGLPFIKECAPGEKAAYIVFPGNTPRTEKLVAFFDHLLSWQGE